MLMSNVIKKLLTLIDVVLVFLLLTDSTHWSDVSITDFEKVMLDRQISETHQIQNKYLL